MTKVAPANETDFFAQVEATTKKAIWCALATSTANGPRVRMVHPTWEGKTLWFATGADSPKAAQLRADPRVDVQFQVAPPDFVHLMVRGEAQLVEDVAGRQHAWELLDYDLSQFWPGGADDPSFVAVRIEPRRVELSKMFGSQDKQVWTG